MKKAAFLKCCGSLVRSGRWRVVSTDQIRLLKEGDIRPVPPVSAVGMETLNESMPEPGLTFKVAEALHLNTRTIHALYRATDLGGPRKGFRGQLLRALGV